MTDPVTTDDVTPDEMTPAQLLNALRTTCCVDPAAERCCICVPCVAAHEIERLRDALREIASYPPGTLRPLADEIAIYKLATEALQVDVKSTQLEK